jgi:anthranilate phosphoribosyltransferase
MRKELFHMFNEMVKKLLEKKNLDPPEMAYCMERIMSGEVTEIQIAAFLTALKIKGETVERLRRPHTS